MANTDMRKRLAMMLESSSVIISGIPPITTRKHNLLSLKAFGGTEQNDTPTPDAPMDIVCNNGVLKVNSQGQIYTDGTVETINVHGKNLFDYANNKAFVSEGQTVTISFINPGYRTTVITDTDVSVMTRSSVQTGYQSATVVIPAGTTYLSIAQGYGKASEVQIELGSTATDYEPYYDGGTPTAEMLLKVGNYQDQQEIISGVVTRNVGVKVLDGTEGWTMIDATSGVPFATFNLALSTTAAGGISNVPRCSHFRSATSTGKSNIPDNGVGVTANSTYTTMWFRCDSITTTNDFTAWLAAQYAAGTPVIVVYPLAEPTTETVLGQTIAFTSGTNIIDITQASLNNLELEIKAK